MLGVELYTKALEDLSGKLDGRDGRKAHVPQVGGDAKLLHVDDFSHHCVQFLLQNVQRCCYLAFFRFGFGCFGFGQRTFVHFLVLVERDGVNLHRYGRYHVWRLAVHDKGVEGLYVNLLVADHVSGYVLASVGVVKRLHGSILDARKLANDGFHLFEFDTETADLDLSVAPAFKLDVSVFAVTDYISGLVAAQTVPVNECLSRFLGLVEIAESHLRAGNQQFARGACGRLMAVLIDHNQLCAVVVSLADGYIGFVACDHKTADIDGALCRSVAVHELVTRRVEAHEFLTACA